MIFLFCWILKCDNSILPISNMLEFFHYKRGNLLLAIMYIRKMVHIDWKFGHMQTLNLFQTRIYNGALCNMQSYTIVPLCHAIINFLHWKWNKMALNFIEYHNTTISMELAVHILYYHQPIWSLYTGRSIKIEVEHLKLILSKYYFTLTLLIHPQSWRW